MDSHGLPVVKVSRRGANRLTDGHVWVYRSDILAADGIAPGALVGVTDEREKFLGTALYSSCLANRCPYGCEGSRQRSGRLAAKAHSKRRLRIASELSGTLTLTGSCSAKPTSCLA
jgi:23S rRNA G2069 N7-methylase RlmK/C1962 C5-methylase RlmI